MGQSESKEEEPKHPHNQGAAATSLRKHASVRDSSRDHGKRNAPPSAAFAAATTPSTSTSTSTTHAHATTVSHTRARSITTSGAKSTPLHELPAASSHKSETAAMGANHSLEHRHRPPLRAATLPPPPVQDEEDKPDSAAAAQPVDVPMQTGVPEEDFVPIGLPTSTYGLPPSDFTRPPRLPLPIEEELHTPGSPIINPQELGAPIDHTGVDGPIARQASVLSSTTVDDDDVGDDDYLPEYTPKAALVPTTLEWKGHGEKVYVTGTFVNWEKKFKLHKNPNGPGYSTTISLRPGTHHIKFLVHNDMFTSDDLPTTVDYTNVLVNYIEVAAPKTCTPPPVAPAEPMPIPGAAKTEIEGRAHGDTATKPLDIRSANKTSETDADLASTLNEPDSRKPSVAEPEAATAQQQKLVKQLLPRGKYTNQLPEYLHHLDVYTNPDDERSHRVGKVIAQLPQPPSLPMFMGKTILNGQTPLKDDSSVLIVPNHTVLNHLATSSIKSGVLATSGTTRYKRKFLTTIMYKPTSDAG